MSEPAQFPPDITLAVDGEGVIRNAVCAEALADEALDQWRGMRWTDTVPPEAAAQVAGPSSPLGREGKSSCFTVNQRLPSGRELMLEYTTVKLGKRAGFVAIGKSVEDMSDLKSRLAFVQKERERDYWKLREIETRYRALLDASSEAVALGARRQSAGGRGQRGGGEVAGPRPRGEFLPDLAGRDRKALEALLETARMNGRAPSIVLHLLESRTLEPARLHADQRGGDLLPVPDGAARRDRRGRPRRRIGRGVIFAGGFRLAPAGGVRHP